MPNRIECALANTKAFARGQRQGMTRAEEYEFTYQIGESFVEEAEEMSLELDAEEQATVARDRAE